MSNRFCSAKKGRLIEVSIECWELLTSAYDEDRLTLLQDKQYEELWQFVETGEHNAEVN